MSLKVLIITYYWPPAGGPGVQRWLKFVKYFQEFGIEPIVYIPENPTYAIEDPSLILEIPEGITILKHPIFEPYRFASLFSKKETKTISKGIIAKKEKQSFFQRLLLYIRGNFFIPDARKYWIRPSINFLGDYIDKNNIKSIVTTGPPHSVHLIGLGLHKKMGVKWVADFRDPWTSIGYHKQLKLSAAASQKHTYQEKEVLQSADHVVVTSFTTAKEFENITEKPVTVITNGYDTEIKEDLSLDAAFTVSHIGSLLSGRNPLVMWKALFDLTVAHKDFAKNFRLQLIGAVSDDVISAIRDAGLSPYLKIESYVSHGKAIQLQKSTHVLLLIEINSPETIGIIPGKLFEYMAANRPIIAVGPKGADISKLILETNTGHFYEYDAYKDIKDQLLSYFKAYQNKTVRTETRKIEKYSRRELTKRMAALLKDL